MRRDSIFYKLFQKSPTLLFELVSDPPASSESYRFDSVAVKDAQFTIDGVFLPPEGDPDGVVYFVEVQFQRDELLYERAFAESLLYFYQNREKFQDWQLVVIYPSRSIEQRDYYPYRGLLSLDQVHRVFLQELGEIRELPLWVAAMVLTTVKENQMVAEAQGLLSRIQAEVDPTPKADAIMEMVVTVVSYRFAQLNRQEIEAMLNITFEETRLYQDLREDATRKGREEGIQLAKEQTARNLLAMGIDPQKIATATDLRLEQVLQLRDKG